MENNMKNSQSLQDISSQTLIIENSIPNTTRNNCSTKDPNTLKIETIELKRSKIDFVENEDNVLQGSSITLENEFG